MIANLAIRALVVSLLLAATTSANFTHAAVTAVSPSTTSNRIPLARSGTVSITWGVTTNTAGNVTITSTQGNFKTPTAVPLGSVVTTLSSGANGPTTVSIREAVAVPGDIAYRAHKQGFDKVIYERSFNDGGGALIGQVTLFISTPASASFSISRIELKFDDDKPITTVKRGDVLKARAILTVSGAGILKGTWEIAGPNPADDPPKFRVARQVSVPISSSDLVILEGPELSTEAIGTYLLRFRSNNPEAAIEMPTAKFVVR